MSAPTPEMLVIIRDWLASVPGATARATEELMDAYEAMETRFIVLAYATWSEEYYAASWYTHSPESVAAARKWWAEEGHRPLEDFEQAVVEEWHKQEAPHD